MSGRDREEDKYSRSAPMRENMSELNNWNNGEKKPQTMSVFPKVMTYLRICEFRKQNSRDQRSFQSNLTFPIFKKGDSPLRLFQLTASVTVPNSKAKTMLTTNPTQTTIGSIFVPEEPGLTDKMFNSTKDTTDI